MKMYHLGVDGTSTRIPISTRIDINTLSIQSLSPTYTGETIFYCVDPSINLYLVMHPQNSPKYRNEKTLPLNQCLRSFLPEASFVGEMLLVKSDDYDKLDIKTIWTPEILRQYDIRVEKRYSFIRR